MMCKEERRMAEYYKIMLVCLEPDSCRILKGPKEERRLAEILQDDYHVSRYEKMMRLVVRELVEERCQEEVFRLLSLEHLKEAFEKGERAVTCSYRRIVNGKMQKVCARAYPRKFGEKGELIEFMIYVFQSRNDV